MYYSEIIHAYKPNNYIFNVIFGVLLYDVYSTILHYSAKAFADGKSQADIIREMPKSMSDFWNKLQQWGDQIKAYRILDGLYELQTVLETGIMQYSS